MAVFWSENWNILPSDIKTLEHFDNSQRKLSEGFLRNFLVESVMITYFAGLQIIITAEKNVGFSIHILSKG